MRWRSAAAAAAAAAAASALRIESALAWARARSAWHAESQVTAVSTGAGVGTASGCLLQAAALERRATTTRASRCWRTMMSPGGVKKGYDLDYRGRSEGDHAASLAPPVRVSCLTRADSTSSTHSCLTPLREEVNTMCRLSGAHEGSSFSPSLVHCFTVRSRSEMVMIWKRPPICDWNAIRRPSRDQSGLERYDWSPKLYGVSRSAFVPSASLIYTSGCPERPDVNAIRRA